MSERLSTEEREVLRAHLATQWTDDPAIAVTITLAVIPAVERILAAHLADANSRLAAVEEVAVELREMAGDHSERLSDFEDGYSAACADADRLVRAALHPDPSDNA